MPWCAQTAWNYIGNNRHPLDQWNCTCVQTNNVTVVTDNHMYIHTCMHTYPSIVRKASMIFDANGLTASSGMSMRSFRLIQYSYMSDEQMTTFYHSLHQVILFVSVKTHKTSIKPLYLKLWNWRWHIRSARYISCILYISRSCDHVVWPTPMLTACFLVKIVNVFLYIVRQRSREPGPHDITTPTSLHQSRVDEMQAK